MEPWGATLYGDPCRACGFDWSLTAEQAVDRVSDWGLRPAETVGDAGSDTWAQLGVCAPHPVLIRPDENWHGHGV